MYHKNGGNGKIDRRAADDDAVPTSNDAKSSLSSQQQWPQTSQLNATTTTMMSPKLLFMLLLFGLPLAYYTGKNAQPQVLQLLSSTILPSAAEWGAKNGTFHDQSQPPITTAGEFPIVSTRRKELLDAAIYKRTRIMTNDLGAAECKQEVSMLEEVFFSEKQAFGQYHITLTKNGDDEAGDEEDDDDDGERKDPLAAHVMMDMERLSSDFLKDTDRIRQAMFDTVWEASEEHDIHILSVHCQERRTAFEGVMCVAILEDGNHMTVLTDPVGQMCSIDLLIAGRDHLLDVVPMLEKNFAADGDKPLMRFRQIFRGERIFAGRWETMDNDLTELLLEYKDDFFFKKEIGSMTSDFQDIHVWEGLNVNLQSVNGYERSLESGVNNYYTQNPNLFHPNRQLYMDGVMQSSTIGDEAYHEGLVHPAMFAHAEGPKRVAIIGGGEGATLREILKHKSVEVCTMIEIDPGIVEASRLWLPSMNDCSDFGMGNCFDERRTELRLEDAFGYFLNRFKREGEVPEELKTDRYDVIVMDALDPDDTIEFAVQMYQDTVFWGTLHEALTHNGILVVQLGMTPESSSYGEQFGVFKNRANLFESIESAGFEQMFIYHDTHSDFKFPWSYLIACKSDNCVQEWNQNEAEINLRMHERILPSKLGEPMLKHFDGATMQSYMRPYKAWETVHCRKVPKPEECTLFDRTSRAVSWNDAFELVAAIGDIEPKHSLIAKMDLTAGTAIYYAAGRSVEDGLSALVNEHHAQKAFPTIETATFSSKPACGVTRKLSNVDLSGKISPLQERQPHLFEMVETIKDVFKGETFLC